MYLSVIAAQLWQKKGRLLVSVLAIALGVALGYAVQLINHSAANEFAQALFTLTDGNIISITGVAAGDKRWIQVTATKDAALEAKAQKRAFEVASYRYDAIFRPLEQLLVPKETKPPVPRSSPAPTP